MKLIKEHIDFQRNIDPKKAMSIGELNSIVRLLLLNPIDDYFKEEMDSWLNDNPALAQQIEYKGIDDLKNILSFETETICEEDKSLDYELIESDFLKVGVSAHYRGLVLKNGLTRLGKRRVMKYSSDAVSGFIARKEWLLPVVESNFQRNIEPKAAMSIGTQAEFKQFLKDEGLELQPMSHWLNLCVDHERIDLILYLLEKGFSPVDLDGAPLKLACTRGRIDILDLLLDYIQKNTLMHVSKQDAIDIDDGGPLLNALANEHYEMVEHLLDKYDATVTYNHIRIARDIAHRDEKFLAILERKRHKQATFKHNYRPIDKKILK